MHMGIVLQGYKLPIPFLVFSALQPLLGLSLTILGCCPHNRDLQHRATYHTLVS